jgi:signal transduction histidine kinase
LIEGAGLGTALERSKRMGFTGMVLPKHAPYKLTRGERGVSVLTTPLENGSAQIQFNISTIGLLGIRPLLLTILAFFLAALLGLLLGQSLSDDLVLATRRLRLLGTESVLSGAKTMRRPARFAIVQELGQAVEFLAARFRTFARAQEDAILAREAAIRMRSMFFASASHDLKSPLNSILGFTELVRREPLNGSQAESLHAIQSRGRELLALIETILDAARVEAGQLSLMFDEVPFTELYRALLDRTRQLSGDYPLQIWDEIQSDIPPLLVDRIHLSRALATFVAYSVRSTQGGKMRLRAEMESSRHLRIDVDFPSLLYSAKELEMMLARVQSPGKRPHRSMALGLRLARSVIELHKGSVRIIDRGTKGAMFCITLATLESAPSVTPPPDRAS